MNAFEGEYQPAPKGEKTKHLLQRAELLRFPGLRRSIVSHKWQLKNCSTAFHVNMAIEKMGVPEMTMEGNSKDCVYFGPIFFLIARSNKDVPAFIASTVSGKISDGTFSTPAKYEMSGEKQNMPGLLSAGIHPGQPLSLYTA